MTINPHNPNRPQDAADELAEALPPRNPKDHGTRWLFGKPYRWAETDGGRLTLLPEATP